VLRDAFPIEIDPMSKPYLLLATALAAALAGCASNPTRLDAKWINAEFAGKRSAQDVLVLAAVPDVTMRRLFEDRMTARLRGAGVKAVQSYTVIPQDGPVSEERLRQAVASAGMSFALATRIINVTTQVNVVPGMVVGPAWGPGWGWAPGWGPGWGGFAGFYNTAWGPAIPPQITTSQNVHADTRLFDARSAVVIWSAATTTVTGFDSVQQIIEQFVELLVATMTKDGVI
jgi:hypothetical protein